MKLFKIMGAVALTALTACGPEFDYDVTPADLLELGTTTVKFASGSGTKDVSVESNAAWDVLVDEETAWITAEKTEGGIQISAEANPDIYQRTGIVTVATGGRAIEIKVNQEALGVDFVPSKDTVFVGCDGKIENLSVASNIRWIPTSANDWVQIEMTEYPSDATIPITVTANESLKGREANIEIYHDDAHIGRIVVVQDPVVPVITLSPEAITHDDTALRTTVSLTSNWAWTASMSAADSLWITAVMPAAGEDGLIAKGTYTIPVAAGATKPARDGKITFTSGGSTWTLPIHQDGMATNLSVSKKEFTKLNAAGASEKFTVSSNNAWEIKGAPSWVTLSATSGAEGDTEVTLSVGKNDGLARSGEFTVNAGDKVETVSVSQAAGAMSITVIFSDGTSVFRGVLSPSLQSSQANGYDLGPKEESLTSDKTIKFEFYSRGLTLASTASLGLRMNTSPGTYTIKNQLREEDFAYILLPAFEGMKLSSFEFQSTATTSLSGDVLITPTYGSTNSEAIAASISNTVTIAANTKFTLTTTGAKENTRYYVFFTGGKYEIHNFTINYVPAE